MLKFDNESTDSEMAGVGFRLKYPQFQYTFDATELKVDGLRKLLDRWFPK